MNAQAHSESNQAKLGMGAGVGACGLGLSNIIVRLFFMFNLSKQRDYSPFTCFELLCIAL